MEDDYKIVGKRINQKEEHNKTQQQYLEWRINSIWKCNHI